MTVVDDVRSRRAMLTASLGGIAALVAHALARPGAVRAEGETMHVGDDHFTATTATQLKNQTSDNDVFIATSTHDGRGAVGKSTTNAGVYGTSTSGIGVQGVSSSGAGVRGTSASDVGVSGFSSANPGVHGESTSNDGVRGTSESGHGVFGVSDSVNGVRGVCNSGAGVTGTSQTGSGMFANSQQGVGLRASTHSLSGNAAVLAQQVGLGTGVLGYSGPFASTPAGKPRTGVYGHATDHETSRGVWGYSTAGVGVFGQATTGHALRTDGRVRHDRVSGVAIIPAGSTSVTVDPGVDITPESFVLLTPRVNLGTRALWYTTNPTADVIRIWISDANTVASRVAWLLLG